MDEIEGPYVELIPPIVIERPPMDPTPVVVVPSKPADVVHEELALTGADPLALLFTSLLLIGAGVWLLRERKALRVKERVKENLNRP